MFGRCTRDGVTVCYRGIKGMLHNNFIVWCDGDDLYEAASFAEYREQVDCRLDIIPVIDWGSICRM